MLGDTLDGRYSISRLIGEGGMGAVYEGRHTGTGRRVAIKVITGDIAKNPKLAQRFEVEAKAAGTIESEHVVTVLDVGHDARGAPFMVMEHLTGEDLDGLLLRAAPLAPEAAVKIAMQACFGLEQAHRRGIVHRDIKPGNIFLCERDGGKITVKLVDFGVAKLDGGIGSPKLTRTGMLLGSPLYMSPEQARSSAMVDHRTDVWSLGVVLYEMLAGRTPFHDVEALGELILSICSAPAPPLRTLAPWVDPALAAAVERALALDPNARFQSAAEMAEALRAFSPGGSSEITAAILVRANGAPPAEIAPLAILPPAVADLPLTTVKEGRTPRGEALQRFAKTEAGAPLLTPSSPAPPPPAAPPPGFTPAVTPPSSHVGTPFPASAPLTPHQAHTPYPISAPPPAIAPLPGLATPPPARNLTVPLVVTALVLVAGALGGAFAMGLIGGGGGSGGKGRGDAAATAIPDDSPLRASQSPVLPASNAGGKPPASSAAGSMPPAPASPLAPLVGAWKSDSGRVYDAVLAGGAVELRLRDAAQLAGQGYQDGEARFVLSAIPNETATFNVEDRLRPLPPENTSYDLAQARPTCLVTWTEVDGKPLRANLSGDQLRLNLVVFKADKTNFVLENGRAVRCTGLARVPVSETTSVLTRQ